MANYYTGSKINEDRLFFKPKLLDIKPKPKSYWIWCNLLEDLENEVIKNAK